VTNADSPSLEVLNIGGNPIGDDGLSLISRELQCNDVLIDLNIGSCGLSANGMVA